ncbi:MAG: hypothetical protein EHM24_21040 [Acidobacteria bacterium]|nr:MAG: hypothetical protein EHM24_21040 [Acidobacteriota bacterium]
MRLYRAIALLLAVTFAVTGLVFLAAPGQVNVFLDRLGVGAGQALPAADLDSGLFRALAGAYMYLVSLLAWLMFRRPAEPAWPALLAHAKLASAAISFVLFAAHRPYLVYLINGVVDGLLGTLALVLRRQAVRAARQHASRGVPA